MNCPICSAHLIKDDRPDYFSLLRHKCHNHQYRVSIFSYRNDPYNIVSYNFYVFYKDVKWKIDFNVKDSVCQISYLATINLPELVTFGRKTIANFPIDIGLTPENILKKLPTIITFS